MLCLSGVGRAAVATASPSLISILPVRRSGDCGTETRCLAISILGRLSQEHLADTLPAVPALAQLRGGSTEPLVRRNAGEALRRIGDGAPAEVAQALVAELKVS